MYRLIQLPVGVVTLQLPGSLEAGESWRFSGVQTSRAVSLVGHIPALKYWPRPRTVRKLCLISLLPPQFGEVFLLPSFLLHLEEFSSFSSLIMKPKIIFQ